MVTAMRAGNHSERTLAVIAAVVLLTAVGGSEPGGPTAAKGIALAAFTGSDDEGYPNYGLQGAYFEQDLGRSTEKLLKGSRRWFRQVYRTLSGATGTWGTWLGRALLFVPIAVIALLVDRGLVTAWRREGARVLANYIPLMLYVHARLALTPKVPVTRKLLLVGAMAYGVYRRDLVPDRAALISLADDVLVIVLAARIFLAGCSEQLVRAYAMRAVIWRRRFLALQRARQR